MCNDRIENNKTENNSILVYHIKIYLSLFNKRTTVGFKVQYFNLIKTIYFNTIERD